VRLPATHLVKKARYPAIDFHGHPQGMLGSVESLARLAADLDSLNVRMMIVANNVSGDALKRTVATINASPSMKDRLRVLTGINFQNVGPGWAERAVELPVFIHTGDPQEFLPKGGLEQ